MGGKRRAEGVIRWQGRCLITGRYPDRTTANPFPALFKVAGPSDYFGLIWHDEEQPLPDGTRHVTWDELPPELVRMPAEKLPVFCPVSGTVIPELIAGLHLPRPMQCLGRFGVALGDLARRTEWPRLMGGPVEDAVVLLTGVWPEQLASEEARARFLIGCLEHQFGAELQQAASVGLTATLLHVDHLTDEEGPLAALLQETLYPRSAWEGRVFVSGPIHDMGAPFEQMMCCLVWPQRRPGSAT